MANWSFVMQLFDSTTLLAAKDAGIPISVLVAILSIFLAIATISKQAPLRVLLFGGITTICLMYIFWASTRELYQWVDTKALGDWVGNDEGWTDGGQPLPLYCDRNREGNVATCWRNRPEGYPANPPPMFTGSIRNGAWCAYKLREDTNLVGASGRATGRIFICARVSL